MQQQCALPAVTLPLALRPFCCSLPQRLKDFLVTHRPGVIAVGAGAEGNSKRMFQALYHRMRPQYEGDRGYETSAYFDDCLVVSAGAEGNSKRISQALYYRVRLQYEGDRSYETSASTPSNHLIKYRSGEPSMLMTNIACALRRQGLIPEALDQWRRGRSGARGRNKPKRRAGGSGYGSDDSEGFDSDNDMDDDFDGRDWTTCEAHLIRDDVARIFATSERGRQEFSEAHENLRSAVSLARMMQEPLAEYTNMWTSMESFLHETFKYYCSTMCPHVFAPPRTLLPPPPPPRGSSGEFGHEMLSLRLHPLQGEVTKGQLLRALEQRLIDAVNEVGVDINMACEKEHMRGMLQFVAGLGPRKAAALRTGISQSLGGVINSRRQLLDRKLLGPSTYTNAASFLRIRKRGRLEERDDINPFDDTRIHTECYIKHHWARQICANALDVDPEDYQQCVAACYIEHHWARQICANALDVDPEDYQQCVASIMDDSREVLRATLDRDPDWRPENPESELKDKLEELDLVEFAGELERQGLGKRRMQLEAVKDEIRFPYRERRRPFQRASDDDVFEWITGEDDATLRPGMVVTCSVSGHTRGGVRATVEGLSRALLGFIPMDKLQDDPLPPDADLALMFPRNSIRSAVIADIRKPRFEVQLSLRRSDTQQNPAAWGTQWRRPMSLPPIDREFDHDKCQREWAERLAETQALLAQVRLQDVAQRGGTGGAPPKGSRIFQRSIVHPNFRNVTFQEAEAKLKAGAEVGDVIIRPSSKSRDMLTITWMWQPGEFKHIEEEYESLDEIMARYIAPLNEEYESLDKIMARYIAPLNLGVAEMLAHRINPLTLIMNKTECSHFVAFHMCAGGPITGGEEYESLDEIMARYIAPLNDGVAEMLAHPKYKDLPRKEVEDLVMEMKRSAPSSIPYLFARHGSPGYFVLFYIPGKSVRSELIEVTDKGFKIRTKELRTVPELVNWFKKNFNNLPPMPRSQQCSKHYYKGPANDSALATADDRAFMLRPRMQLETRTAILSTLNTVELVCQEYGFLKLRQAGVHSLDRGDALCAQCSTSLSSLLRVSQHPHERPVVSLVQVTIYVKHNALRPPVVWRTTAHSA
ncbi:hypothetical protein JKP88DRAFT_265969 [Tribonema minus]|uniref:S1 motif domain-containing protein n=1 Tax=Tribonema minus TaxID=303371 RepID=A0A836C842_9STRA|nr:hypothetical protein JKP88DRAFT_265969 [Tribonema minus]